jgi:prepilin-type N-terminal cleavage/methylation domain-containing protein
MVKTNQKGFTLLELAIVLVIIGIILGAILKGQELINNAKAKRLLNDTKGLATLQYTFYDRYGRFAGDCDNNGAIDALANSLLTPESFNTNKHQFCYDPNNIAAQPADNYNAQWEELAQAQLISFSNARDVARNPYNGALYSAYVATQNPFVAYNVIVATNVPCYAAKVVDQAIDGSIDANSGNVRILSGNNFGNGTTSDPTWGCTSEQQLVAYVYFFDRRPN